MLPRPPNSTANTALMYSRNTAIWRVWGWEGFVHCRIAMADSLAAVVLAAGAGTRLAPLTSVRPKALCPVGDRPLVDSALDRVEAVVGAGPDRVAVNAHAHHAQLETHVAGRASVSVEEPVALGTAGAVAHLRPWLDGRPALVVNADAWAPGDLGPLVE